MEKVLYPYSKYKSKLYTKKAFYAFLCGHFPLRKQVIGQFNVFSINEFMVLYLFYDETASGVITYIKKFQLKNYEMSLSPHT